MSTALAGLNDSTFVPSSTDTAMNLEGLADNLFSSDPGRATYRVASQIGSNFALATNLTQTTYDALLLAAGIPLLPGQSLLLFGQSTAAENGVVAITMGSELVSGGASYTAGSLAVTVTANRMYWWQKGPQATGCTNGTVTILESGWISSATTTITIEGTAGEDAFDSLKPATLAALSAYSSGKAVGQTIAIRGGLINPDTIWKITSLSTLAISQIFPVAGATNLADLTA